MGQIRRAIFACNNRFRLIMDRFNIADISKAAIRFCIKGRGDLVKMILGIIGIMRLAPIKLNEVSRLHCGPAIIRNNGQSVVNFHDPVKSFDGFRIAGVITQHLTAQMRIGFDRRELHTR